MPGRVVTFTGCRMNTSEISADGWYDFLAMENSIFREAWNRVRRAQIHPNAFADHWDALIKPDAFGISLEYGTDRTGLIKFQRRFPYVPDASLELGEFFYQLRAALDSLAFTAARKVGGDSSLNENSIYFPIVDSAERYKRYAKNPLPLPKQLGNWIKSIQLCFAHESSDALVKQIAGYLWFLHDCARKDRHRRLAVLGACGSQLFAHISFTPPVELEHVEGVPCNFFESEGALAKFRIAEHVPGLQVDLRASLELDVVLENIRFPGPNLFDILDNVRCAVEHVIVKFEEAFAQRMTMSNPPGCNFSFTFWDDGSNPT
jgi:hypothetical protein